MQQQPSTEEAARKIVRHLRANAGREVSWKEMANAAGARPERVKDAVAHLTGVNCAPIHVAGSGCTYANSKVRRRTPPQQGQEGIMAAKQIDLGVEMSRLRDDLMEMATRCETLLSAVRKGEVELPHSRDPSLEGAALRSLREERGIDRETMAAWLGKAEIYVADLEDGKRVMTDAEAREMVKELRIAGPVFNIRLGSGQPVFPWKNPS